MITPQTSRAARALLEWHQITLANQAGVSIKTVSAYERGAHPCIPATVAVMMSALERAGVEFLPGGVRLRRQLSNGEDS
jgi:transcriptional regulator with XRE-family HTH domain